MRRTGIVLGILGVGILSLTGCQKNQVAFDPFSMTGPTLMPPPSTGSAGRPDPYFRPSSPAAVTGATTPAPQAQ